MNLPTFLNPLRRWWESPREVLLVDGSAHALGVTRILVFSLWTFIVATVHLEDIAALPFDMLEQKGILAVIPDGVWRWMWTTPAFLIGFKTTLLAALVWCVFGFRPFNVVAIPTCAMLVLFDGMAKSFGHVNHSKFALLFSAFILAAFPSADVVSMRRARPLGPPARYAAPLFSIVATITICYAFIGIYRLDDTGISVFGSNALKHWFLTRGYEPSPSQFQLGIWIAERPPLMTMFKAGFGVVGTMEVLSPLCLISSRFRLVWVIVMAPFHVLSLLTMNIFFWPNVLIILLLFTGAHRFFDPRRRSANPPVLFFDGDCGLCNRAAKFFIARDVYGVFQLATLQGETARERLPEEVRATNPDSIVLLDDTGSYRRSDAALRAMSRLGGLWRLLAPLLRLVPSPIRDAIYDWVARNRIRWFGKVEACAIMTPEQRARVLP